MNARGGWPLVELSASYGEGLVSNFGGVYRERKHFLFLRIGAKVVMIVHITRFSSITNP